MPTDDRGVFELSLPKGIYLLKITYTGYKTSFNKVEVANQNIKLVNISLGEDVRALSNVVVEQLAKRGEQKGDTTEFNANAFKTNPDATTEDLVAKMPGVTIENGTVKARGEDVKRVLVDGKPFFGNDPGTVLKNMPADIVDKVQVFDKGSDQSQFTGFSDGNEERTINIITKPGTQNGVFGKVYAGYGYLDAHRYAAGANVNWFNGNRSVSFLGMSNNINQQNFAIEDIIGVSGSSGWGGGGGRRAPTALRPRRKRPRRGGRPQGSQLAPCSRWPARCIDERLFAATSAGSAASPMSSATSRVKKSQGATKRSTVERLM